MDGVVKRAERESVMPSQDTTIVSDASGKLVSVMSKFVKVFERRKWYGRVR